MIDFTLTGEAIVSFDIVSSKCHARSRLELPLSEYLALVKSATTLEKLRVLLFTHAERNERAQAAGAV
jgi:hypothetical protein